MIDLFQQGAYARTAGGNTEVVYPVSWVAWSLNSDNGGGGGKAVWDRSRSIWRQAGIEEFPWMHVRSMEDLQRLLQVAQGEKSPAIGLNIEDVVGDGLDLEEIARVVQQAWQKPVHMPTLPWVQNEQGWKHLAFTVTALEIFPDENEESKKVAECVAHAFTEGLTKVTLMFKTKLPASTYDLSICHSLFTADDVQNWNDWQSSTPCRKLGGAVTDPWYLKPYKKGTAVGPPKLPRVLKWEEDALVMQGDDVLAMKRAISHAQRWLPWEPSQWDKRYRKTFAMGKGTGQVAGSGVRGFQRQEGLPQTGVVDDATYQRIRRALIPIGPREGAPILDATSIQLIKDAIWEFSPEAKLVKIRAAITDFCLRAEDSEELWHYTQKRPFTGLGVVPERTHENDCSSYVILAYYWARQQTSVLVPDPSGYRYAGFGNTWDDLDGHPRVYSGNYLVGDLAHYDGHVTICRKSGDASSAVWSSFGAEDGPEPLPLYYRGDLRFVCRPPLLPA